MNIKYWFARSYSSRPKEGRAKRRLTGPAARNEPGAASKPSMVWKESKDLTQKLSRLS